MTLSANEQYDLRGLQPEHVAAQPRSAEMFDFWFDKSRYVRRLGGKVNARLRVAMLAIPENRRTILQRFIDRKPSRVDFTTAHVAAALDSVEVLDLAIQRKDDLSTVWLRRTCLCVAAELGHVEVAKALLDRGAPREVPGALDPLSLGTEHPAIVELLSFDGLSPKQLETLLRAAARRGDRAEIEAIASRLQAPPTAAVSCKDEDTAIFVLETLPALRSGLVYNGSGLETEALADAMIARGKITARDIANRGRMNEEGLLRLVGACEKIGSRLGDRFSASTLIDVVAGHSKVRVVQELERRGAKITQKMRRRLLEDSSTSSQMRLHLIDYAELSHAEFLRAPAAEGFAGRFANGRFFGLALGEPKPKRRLPDVRICCERGRIIEIHYGRYDIPGRAFEALCDAIAQEHGPPKHQTWGLQVWADAQRQISVARETNDAGERVSLVVRRAESPRARTPQALAVEFENTFHELENVEFRPQGEGFEIAATVCGRDACIAFTWPVNPMAGEGFSSQFVDTVLSELGALWEEDGE
ncbi:MAG: hypothetical protein AAGA54_20810 [Myxococcota bacterium]